MSFPVTYYCPHCGTLAEVERDGYLDDKAVTPYPLAGWTYDRPESVFGDAPTGIDESDGVRFVCGEPTEGVTWKAGPDLPDDVDPDDLPDGVQVAGEADAAGCGEPFYLSFVNFENGQEVEADAERERVQLAESHGPSGPDGPDGPDTGGFY